MSESSKKLSMSGETIADMDKQEIEKFVGRDAATKIFNKIYMMKQIKMKEEAGVKDLALEGATPTFLDTVFRPEDIVPETIEESLNRAGFKDIIKIIQSCTDELEQNKVLKVLKMSRDEAYAILAYTYQADKTEDSPYRILNQALLDKNTERLKTLRGFILNLLSALRKLKTEVRDCLYRGIDGRWLKEDQNNFGKGNALVFAPFTSTSTEESVAFKFINDVKVEIPVLYEMHGEFQGYLIEDFSKYPSEKGKQNTTVHSANPTVILFRGPS